MAKRFLPKFNRDDNQHGKTQFLTYSLLGIIIVLLFAQIISQSHISIPGFVSLALIILLASHFVYNKKVEGAIRSVYLFPIPIYFLFISTTYAVIPPSQSYYLCSYALAIGYVFYMIFGTRTKHIVVYALLSSLVLLLHIYSTGKIEDITNISWGVSGYDINPFLGYLFLSLTFVLVYYHFQNRVGELKEEIKIGDRRFNRILHELNHAILVLDIVRDSHGEVCCMKINNVNRKFMNVFNITARNIKGVEVQEVFLDVFRNNFDWHGFYTQQKSESPEIYFEHIERWMQVYNVKSADDQIISFYQDITPHKLTINRLQDSKQRYKALLEAVPDIYFVIDKDGLFIDYVAKENSSITINTDDIVGKTIFDVGFSDKMGRRIYQSIQNVVKFDTIESIEYAFDTPHGTMLFEMRMVRLNDHSVISLARDITKRKLAEQKLEEAKINAENADKLKSAFLANLSHEVRTPMNAIIGFSQMLRSDDFDSEERNRFINIINQNGEVLLGMIDNMISLSKIESDQIMIKKSFFKVNQVLSDVFRLYTHKKNQDIEKAENIKLSLHLESQNQNFLVYSDQSLLEEILKHLLDNALKFTEYGEVKLGYKIKTNNKIEFFVSDTGIGIPFDVQDQIFDRFNQGDMSRSRVHNGTGLGLSIANNYAQKLGAEIRVASELHQGSLFFFEIQNKNQGAQFRIVR